MLKHNKYANSLQYFRMNTRIILGYTFISCYDHKSPARLTVLNIYFRCLLKRLGTTLIIQTYSQKSRCHFSPAFICQYINSNILNAESNSSSITWRSLNILHVTYTGTAAEIHFIRVRYKELLSRFSLPFIRTIFRGTAWRVTLVFELQKQHFMESREY